MDKVICVLVLYKPSLTILDKVIDAVIQQVDFLWVSDNTPGGSAGAYDLISHYSEKANYFLMDGNEGIARAQNRGIIYALENGYDFIYFLDQDSISPLGLVYGLKSKFVSLEHDGINVGGIGPQPINRDTGKRYQANINKGVYIRDDVREVSEIICSASLVKCQLFKVVGLMDEDLFIDNVDQEICWRSSQIAGYRFFMIMSLFLSHKVGEGDHRFLGVSVKIYVPFRMYYQYRNYFYLIRRAYVPIYWKFSNGVKYFCKFFYCCLFCESKKQYLVNIVKGTFNGLLLKK